MKIDNNKVADLGVAFLEALNKYGKDNQVNYLEVISAVDVFRDLLIKNAEKEMKKMQESN